MTLETQQKEAAKVLEQSMKQQRASLTKSEQAFLRALLLDDKMPNHEECLTNANKKLNDEILFSLPFVEKEAAKPPAVTRPQHNQRGLWSAFEDGVLPKTLVRESLKKQTESEEAKKEEPEDDEEKGDSDDERSIRSDEEVRKDKDDQSENSSWGEDDVAPDHYDAWEVLKDEYSKDFGFDYKLDHVLTAEEMDDGNHYFRILGTSANDRAAHPHVLSPPLMDSLMTFLPDSVANENWWLKYSLVRDGASLDTMRRYVRATPRTILAIETTDGSVFGSFTSSSWRNERKHYFGSGETFLWRMRHTRNNKCNSLFEQAKMETEIDVFVNSGSNDMIQLSNDDVIAVGGGELDPSDDVDLEERSERFGFGLSVSYDMLHGTSAPCATYRNTCLVDGGAHGKRFEIVNLEVWTMTPCYSVDEAEKLEMSHFFIRQQSTRSYRNNSLDADDFLQDRFYRRVGEGIEDNEQQRDIWQYANMMNTSK